MPLVEAVTGRSHARRARVAFIDRQMGNVPFEFRTHHVRKYGELREHADAPGCEQVARAETPGLGHCGRQVNAASRCSSDLQYLRQAPAPGHCKLGAVCVQHVSALLPHLDPGVAIALPVSRAVYAICSFPWVIIVAQSVKSPQVQLSDGPRHAAESKNSAL